MSEKRRDVHNSDVPILCRSCEARHKGMCGVLEPEELVALARRTHKTRHEPGAELIGESTEIRSYANVMRGVVKLTKGLEDGRQQVVGLQFAPDFLGRLFGDESQTTALAASDVDLCVVPRGALEQLIAENPALEHRLMQQTLRELDEARDWMVTLGRKTAQEKVASFLHLIALHADPHRPDGALGAVFDLPLSRADIADFLGLTIETVSRQMTKLRQAGVITITANRHVEVPNLRRLADMCG
ncbi:Crp/Fnr family transcriptional regulator [Arsenicitalea aurantiaca]|uniref:Crp/Fnr family transcriptional regulator n=1 Tax=Arsenicitalea aurantiaca TaxID=1783274 RepID=A0A433XLU7_9HYPH|nr:Crp/Fnr family transcriptional regulator [Arsenicitalea aurantiaca]RUT35055.1 Crp/Fnr family transcriptional regulator [Arsenicitalea aurantiaca]